MLLSETNGGGGVRYGANAQYLANQHASQGKTLGTEIPAPSANCRAFLFVSGYSIDPDKHGRPSIYLNADHSDVRFRIRALEVGIDHMEDWDSDYFEHELVLQEGIATLPELEGALRAYVDDFSVLVSDAKLAY